MPADFGPIIDAIAKLIGSTGESAVQAAEKGAVASEAVTRSVPGRAVTGVGRAPKVAATAQVGHTSLDVEKALGESLQNDPVKQAQTVHDYLRGAAALDEAGSTGATHVREISVPVWEAAQRQLQQRVDADPEVTGALRRLYIMKNTAPDPTMHSVVVPDLAENVTASSQIAPEGTSKMSRVSDITAGPSMVTVKTRDQAWKGLADGIEGQNSDAIAVALEQITALEPAYKASLAGHGDMTPEWQQAIDYMQALEEKAAEWQQAKLPHDQWAPSIDAFREQAGMELSSLPPRARYTVQRVEAWAEAMRPATKGELAGQVAGMSRALQSSFDVSAPGRQGLLMISRPEYWKAVPEMIQQFKDPAYYEAHQAEIRERPTFPLMQDGGLAITGMEGERLGPREEAFRSNLAEKLPFLGSVVKASNRGYVGFLNDVRANVFDTHLQLFKDSGVLKGDGGAEDQKLVKDLCEWINTSTGRGSIGKWDPGIINTVLYSPRLGVSRFQTFNPQYYWKLSPAVRQAALKANMSAGAIVMGLTSLAALGGAKVTWDFRNSDAGKIRIGNTRIDLGGGHMQMLRFLTQLVTAKKMNSETGKVTKLGEGQAWDQSRFDLLVNFVVNKEAPVASLVTDILKGHDISGQPLVWWKEVGSRVVPLAIQDTYQLIGDKGPMGLILAPLAFVGVGVQTYQSKVTSKIPFLGVNGVVPQEQAAAFEQQMMKAESDGTAKAMQYPGFGAMSKWESEQIVGKYVEEERLKARAVWIKANSAAYAKAVREKKLGSGATEFPLVAPEAQNAQQP